MMCKRSEGISLLIENEKEKLKGGEYQVITNFT